ncbi:MAG TPA: SDR family oxidoreductase [Cyclobacteriaceae bacterium]|jgi:short-subunit dehydrogenase|nr:SDR family oxidoreductase [Cyclobacteriaceae bacterium]
MKSKSKTIVITGVSTGIGYGSAKEFINRGYTVFGSVRKKEDAERLAIEFGERFVPLIMDVVDQPAIDAAEQKVRLHLQSEGLGGLINNSGISIAGPLEKIPMDQFINNFDVNVFGLLRVTKAFLPLLGTQKNHPSLPGRILNISSISGKIGAPFLGAYCGTKHAVEAISQSQRRELLRYGIDVVIIGPGPIQTPIWDKGSISVYQDTDYMPSMIRFFGEAVKSGKTGMKLEKCSRKIADIFEANKPRTRYTLIEGKLMNWILPRLLPDRIIDRVLEKKFM